MGDPALRRFFFAVRSSAGGEPGAIGWTHPGGDRHCDVRVPWATLSLDLSAGPASGPAAFLPAIRDARARADEGGEFRLEVLAHEGRGASAPTGFVLEVLDLAVREGITDVVFGAYAWPTREERADVGRFLARVADLRRAAGGPALRFQGEVLPKPPEGEVPPPALGLLPRLHGLDVDPEEPGPLARASPGPPDPDAPPAPPSPTGPPAPPHPPHPPPPAEAAPTCTPSATRS